MVVFKCGGGMKIVSRLFVYEDSSSSTGVLNTVYDKNKMNWYDFKVGTLFAISHSFKINCSSEFQ